MNFKWYALESKMRRKNVLALGKVATLDTMLTNYVAGDEFNQTTILNFDLRMSIMIYMILYFSICAGFLLIWSFAKSDNRI